MLVNKLASGGHRIAAKVAALLKTAAKAGAAVSLLALVLIALDGALFPD